MHVYLVRHGKAGSRHDWDGPDELRPLSKKGRRQADALVARLFDRPIARVLSSPFVRCVETVEPLADKLGLVVERADALAEGTSRHKVLELARSLEKPGAVLCTHGDVIPLLLEALIEEDGLVLPQDYPYAKGSTWDLTEKDGRFAKATYIAPSK
jgi:8-oxo-dGTP diphosphatase